MTLTYGKRESNWIKGIAIFMMLVHHLFGINDLISPIYHYTALPFAKSNLWQIVGTYFKLCVGLFSFTTGYAMYIQRERYERITYRLKKAWDFLLQYWFVFLLFLIVGVLFSLPLPPLSRLVPQAFGLCTGTGYPVGISYRTSVHPIFAWYVSFYLVFLLLAPPLLRLFSRFGFWRDNLLFFVLLNASYSLLYTRFVPVLAPEDPIPEALLLAFRLFQHFVIWGNIGIMGYLFAKYDAFSRLDGFLLKLLPRPALAVLSALTIVGMIYLRYQYHYFIPITAFEHTMTWNVFYAPVLVYCLLCILTCLNSTWLSNALNLLARHSTNIWFLHGIFFTTTRCFQWLIYWPRYPLAILAWTLLLCLVMSMAVDSLRGLLVQAFHPSPTSK